MLITLVNIFRNEIFTDKACRFLSVSYFIVISIIFLFFDNSTLPDYLSYQLIYEGWSPRENWEVAFVGLSHFSYKLGISFVYFRALVFLFGITALLTLFKKIHTFKFSSREWRFLFKNFCFLVIFLTIYVFENFAILMRSGLAIALICFSIALALTKLRMLFKCLVISFLLFISFNIHKSATVVIAIMLCSVLHKPILGSINFKLTSHKSILVLFLISSLLLFYLVFTKGHERIGNELAPLNFFRLIAVGFIPILIFICCYFGEFTSLPQKLVEGSWAYSFEVFYLIFALCLLAAYAFGFTAHSGVVLVRLIDLITFVAFIVIIKSGSVTHSLMSSYLVSVSAVFFLATLNMYPEFVLKILFFLGKS